MKNSLNKALIILSVAGGIILAAALLGGCTTESGIPPMRYDQTTNGPVFEPLPQGNKLKLELQPGVYRTEGRLR